MKEPIYEGMYIVSTALSEEAREKALGRIREGIEARGGKIHKTFDHGRRRLGFEIQGQKEGHYYLLYFQSPGEMLKELEKECRLNEDLLRFMTLRVTEVPEKIEFKKLESDA